MNLVIWPGEGVEPPPNPWPAATRLGGPTAAHKRCGQPRPRHRHRGPKPKPQASRSTERRTGAGRWAGGVGALSTRQMLSAARAGQLARAPAAVTVTGVMRTRKHALAAAFAAVAVFAAGCGSEAETAGGERSTAAAPAAPDTAAPSTEAPAAPDVDTGAGGGEVVAAAPPTSAAPPSTTAGEPCSDPSDEAQARCEQLWADIYAEEEAEAAAAEDAAAVEAAEPEPEPPAEPEPAAAEPAPSPPEGTVVFEDLAPDVPEGQAPDPQAAGVVRLGSPGPLRSWPEYLCDEADVTGWGFDGCADYLSRNRIELGDCFYAPARLGVGDSYTYTGPAQVFDPPLDDGTLTKSQRDDGTIIGFSAPKKLDGNLPGPDDMWAWVTPVLEWTETWVYEMAEGPDETEPATSGGQRVLAGQSHVRWAVVGGEPGRALGPGGALASGLLAVPVPAGPGGVPAAC